MQKTLPIARQKLLELLRVTPEPHMREGYVMVFLKADVEALGEEV